MAAQRRGSPRRTFLRRTTHPGTRSCWRRWHVSRQAEWRLLPEQRGRRCPRPSRAWPRATHALGYQRRATLPRGPPFSISNTLVCCRCCPRIARRGAHSPPPVPHVPPVVSRGPPSRRGPLAFVAKPFLFPTVLAGAPALLAAAQASIRRRLPANAAMPAASGPAETPGLSCERRSSEAAACGNASITTSPRGPCVLARVTVPVLRAACAPTHYARRTLRCGRRDIPHARRPPQPPRPPRPPCRNEWVLRRRAARETPGTQASDSTQRHAYRARTARRDALDALDTATWRRARRASPAEGLAAHG